MRKVLRYFYFLLGIACIGYYFILGHSARFGMSISVIWMIGGILLIIAGLLTGSNRVPRWLKWLWRGFLFGGMALAISLGTLVVSSMMQTAPGNLDAIIVLGARVEADGPSPSLQKRINAAIDYLEDNPDTLVIASGGQGSDEPMSEAQCIKEGLIKRGVSADRILLEDKSTSTVENIALSMKLLEDESADVGIITNNYHVYRAVLIAEKAGLENVHGIAAGYTGNTLLHFIFRETVCLVICFMWGEI